jgi:hypothetical protein
MKLYFSESALKNMIMLANDEANQILYNSGMGFRYRIIGMYSAGAGFVEPTGSDAFGTLLDWLTNPTDGYLDQAQTLRQQLGADEVLLVNAANAYCGLAWVNRYFSKTLGYANYNAGCLWGGVWGHEIGHNFGCYHDRFSDAQTAANNPTYLGFGNCWEDTSKNDCTCYSSVMVYDCNTVPNGCTSCTSKNYYANYLVSNSGSPTGRTDASCGLWMDQNHASVVNYFPTTQPGGMIFSVYPNVAIGSSCALVNISGWQLSTVGGDISRVTLNGLQVALVEQTENYVMVLTPIVTATSSLTTGDVVVTTSSGRVTTLSKGFTFLANSYTDVQNFKDRKLPAGPWQNNGTIPWSFEQDGKDVALFKDGGVADSENYYTRLLWQSPTSFVATQGGCKPIATSLKFVYKAYSDSSWCYDKFTVSVQQNYIAKWTTIWNGQTLSTGSAQPWISASITLPAQTTAINIFVNTDLSQYCRWWAPGRCYCVFFDIFF